MIGRPFSSRGVAAAAAATTTGTTPDIATTAEVDGFGVLPVMSDIEDVEQVDKIS